MPFPLAGRFMRDFSAVIDIPVGQMWHQGHDRAMGCAIATKFVGNNPQRFPSLPLEQTTEKPFGCSLIVAMLEKNINDIAVLIYGPIQILWLTLYRDKDLIDMPDVTEAALSLFELSCIGDGDSNLGKQLLPLTETETKSMVEPDRVTHHF